MRPRLPFPEGTKELMEKFLKEAKTAEEIKRIQCVLFRVREDYDNAMIARSVGYTEDSVKHIHSRFLRFGESILLSKKKGGRHNAHMSIVEEVQFLSSIEEEGDKGGILELSSVQKSFEATLGEKVHKSIVYRMLHRHGWRKIAPRPEHPKRDQVKADEFKKNFQVLSKTTKRGLWKKEEISV